MFLLINDIKEVDISGENQKLHRSDMTSTKQTKISITLSNWWNRKNFFWNNQVKIFGPINQKEGLTDNVEFMYKLSL